MTTRSRIRNFSTAISFLFFAFSFVSFSTANASGRSELAMNEVLQNVVVTTSITNQGTNRNAALEDRVNAIKKGEVRREATENGIVLVVDLKSEAGESQLLFKGEEQSDRLELATESWTGFTMINRDGMTIKSLNADFGDDLKVTFTLEPAK